jgi:hypothetical protein
MILNIVLLCQYQEHLLSGLGLSLPTARLERGPSDVMYLHSEGEELQ